MNKYGSRTRFTVAIEGGIAELLDRTVAGMGMTRSAVVEEAISEWLRQHVEQERRRLDGGAVDEARLAAMMVLEALRYQFPAMRDVSDDELRSRAMAALEGR